LDQYALCDNFFEESDGKLREKVLGLKLLESSKKQRKRQISEVKDIADTSLMLCGFFPSSIENRIVSSRYYYDIGTLAYNKLDTLVPEYLDQKNFYARLATIFYQLARLLTVVAESFKQDENMSFILSPKKSA
jgi:hypothetical protein